MDQPDRPSNWRLAAEARDRDLIRRVLAYVVEYERTHGDYPTEAHVQQAILDGR